MKSLGSLVPVGLIALAMTSVAGCKKDEPPKPDPATTAASARAKLNVRNPMGPMAKIDPVAMKDYRLDICYYGTLSLRQARDAYLASLGKEEPSEKKLPSFGIPGSTPAPTPAPAPAASGSAKAGPAPTAKPTAAPAAAPSGSAQAGKPAPSGSAAAPVSPERRPDAALLRVPHERNARACTAAIGLKDPPMAGIDEAIAALSPVAVDLAKDITAAHQYYQKEDYKKDNFAKGKELDKKLREEFAKFDELHDKLGAALAAYRKDHPRDLSKAEDGEKLARAAIEDAKDVFMMVADKKADGDAWKAALDKLEKSAAALKDYAGSHAADPWAKIMTGPVDAFVKTAKDSKVANKTFDSDTFLLFISNFTGVIEARQRAVSRSNMARPAPAAAGSGSAAAPELPPGHP
jgi:hypothetical protein